VTPRKPSPGNHPASTESRRRASYNFYHRNQEAGLCGWCTRPAYRGTRCQVHHEKMVERQHKARELAALRKMAQGLCACKFCPIRRKPGKKYCKSHQKKLEAFS
jgi:hypothetical protein